MTGDDSRKSHPLKTASTKGSSAGASTGSSPGPTGPTDASSAASVGVVHKHALAEAKVIMAAFAVCLVWTVGFSARYGYRLPENGVVETVGGIPAWVFWGVFVPWVAATVFSVAYGLFWIRDDDLGEAPPEASSG